MYTQYINISMSAIETSKKAAQRKAAGKFSGRSHWPVSKILAEAGRSHEASQHVKNPIKPNLIYGMSLLDLKILCYETAKKAKFKSGKTIRKDTPILLTIVASFPREIQSVDPLRYEKWKKDTLNFINFLYKSLLKTAIEHLDEEHPHLHFFILPPNGLAKEIHPGYIAEKDVTDPKLKRQRHALGLKKFQDAYWEMVSKFNGLDRVGPARQRLSRTRALLNREVKKKIQDTEIYCNQLKLEAVEILKNYHDLKALELLKSKIETVSKNIKEI